LVKGLLRRALLAPLYRSGLLDAYARRVLRHKAVVLTYHRVLPVDRQRDSFSAPGIIVTPESFDMHMRFVRRFLHPVSVGEFANLLAGNDPMPSGTCVVTFDDGWYDNHAYALPILKAHAIPAAVFVATDYVGSNRCFWQERLSRLLHAVAAEPRTAAMVFALAGSQNPPAGNPDEQRRRIRETVSRLKAKPIAEVLATVAKVTHEVSASGLGERALALGEDRFMSWEQVREMHASRLVTIGSHTETHIPLTKHDTGSAQQEQSTSKAVIAKHTRGECTAFAYPNGDFDDESVDWVRSAGYSLAFTTVRSRVAKGADPLRVGRFNIHEAAARTPAHLLNGIAGPL
jgi:peptidoglycan/xylan/chitin deacetylase (PgdA/CDA1 family)